MYKLINVLVVNQIGDFHKFTAFPRNAGLMEDTQTVASYCLLVTFPVT